MLEHYIRDPKKLAANRNIDNAVHDLSIYLGHAKLESTYWYFSAVPALLNQCAERSEALGLRSRKGGRP